MVTAVTNVKLINTSTVPFNFLDHMVTIVTTAVLIKGLTL